MSTAKRWSRAHRISWVLLLLNLVLNEITAQSQAIVQVSFLGNTQVSNYGFPPEETFFKVKLIEERLVDGLMSQYHWEAPLGTLPYSFEIEIDQARFKCQVYINGDSLTFVINDTCKEVTTDELMQCDGIGTSTLWCQNDFYRYTQVTLSYGYPGSTTLVSQ